MSAGVGSEAETATRISRLRARARGGAARLWGLLRGGARGWRRVPRAVFPGERLVWISALVVLLPLLGLLAYQLQEQRPYWTSTDSIGLVSLDVTVNAHQQLCVPDVEIGAETWGVQLVYFTYDYGPRPPMSVTVREGSRLLASGAVGRGPGGPLAFVTIPITPVIPSAPKFRLVSVCLRLGPGLPTQFGGMFATTSLQAPATLDGVSQGTNRIALWFVPRPDATRSVLQDFGSLMDRVSLFRPAFAGSWLYWLIFLFGLPFISYLGVRVLAVAHEPRRRIALALAVISFTGAAAWALTTVPFDAPDEPEHYAYVESLAETGRAPSTDPNSPLSPYASDEGLALEATRHFADVTGSLGVPPWAPEEAIRYRRELAALRPARNNGGGFATTTQFHSPLYYSLLLPGYALGRGGGTFDELFWMRLTSALLGIIVPLCAYGVVRELAPRRRRLAAAAGLLVAFEPMFTFISGAVNNDVGVNAAAAVVVYLVVRALRRGLTWPIGIALGLAAAVLPLMKSTGYALYPAVALAVLAMVARVRNWRAARDLAAMAAVFIGVDVIARAVAGSFGRGAAPVSSSAAGGAVSLGESVAGSTLSELGGKLVYIWEVFLPRLPFMHAHWNPGQWPFFDIYIQRGIGGFGWYAIYFPDWTYDIVAAVVVGAGALALAATWRCWPAVRARWRELIFLMLVILGVLGGVEAAYYAVTPRPVLSEQGRYAFTALVPIAALAIAGLFALPRRWAIAVATAMVVAMIVLAYASRLLYLTSTFT